MDELNQAASDAYKAFWLSLEGKAPAGLAGPPYDLQTWEQLPASVRDAWCAALVQARPELAPAPAEEADPELGGEG